MHLYWSSRSRFTSLRPGKNDIHQHGYLFFIKAKIRHNRHRSPDREHKLPGCFPDCRAIEAHRKNVPATAADMTAAAGKLIHQALPFFDVRLIAESKAGIFPGTQTGMGNVFAL